MTEALNTLYRQSQALLATVAQPAEFLQDPSKRIFWLYLLASIVIAAFALTRQKQTRWWSALGQQLLSPKLWFHRSSLLDYKLMVVKALARVVFFASWLGSSYGVALGVVRLATDQFGTIDFTSLSDTTITLTYTLILFVTADFSRYLVHRLCHEWPILWQFHQVHHSAEVMTPLTLYRSHPVENLIFVLRGVVVTGLVTGVFFYLFGTRAVQLQLLGVNALGLLFNLLGANLRHSHVWISYGSVVEHVFISPAQHQLHHSKDARHHGANYGSCLALWDWVGGSLHVAFGQKGLTFGLDEAELNHDPKRLTSALLGPFVGAWTVVHQRFRAQRSARHAECD